MVNHTYKEMAARRYAQRPLSCSRNVFAQRERFGPGLYSPAAARSAAALSVRSQVISGSDRPKCPNAAVC